ncbi:hypothetical protein ABPG72_011139 [Tetrahymena utriculariae]
MNGVSQFLKLRRNEKEQRETTEKYIQKQKTIYKLIELVVAVALNPNISDLKLKKDQSQQATVSPLVNILYVVLRNIKIVGINLVSVALAKIARRTVFLRVNWLDQQMIQIKQQQVLRKYKWCKNLQQQIVHSLNYSIILNQQEESEVEQKF